MTVSVSQGRRFTIDEHVRNAWKHAGLVALGQEPTPEEFSEGRTMLQYVMNSLEAEGQQARNTGFFFLPMIADQFQYTLPEGIFDVLSPAMYIDENQTDPERADSETEVRVITEMEYTRLSSKSSRSRAFLVYPDRSADQIVLNFWPIPDATGATVRVRVHRNYFDTDDGKATLDLQRFWDGYILDALASRMASASSLDKKAMVLQASAMLRLKRCKGQAKERPGTQAFVTHKGGYYA